MAIAPNATIGLVAGTVPGIDPRFAQVFSRNTLSGKYLDININLVKDLKNLGLWETVGPKIIEHQGDISGIEEIPDHLKNVYKTSFTTSPYAFVEIAARVQKWVDQALSRNMYLDSREVDETMNIYMTAWEKGLKSTYYLHMKPRHSAEQSTVKVNKSEMTGKRGFGVISGMNKSVANEPTSQLSLVPEERSIPTMVPEPVKVNEPVPSGEVVTVISKEKELVEVKTHKPELKEEARPMANNNSNNSSKLTIHGPEDPQDALLCESCQ